MQVTTELAAIQNAAGVYPLGDQAFLRVTGADATRWLNGMVTNNVRDLAVNEGNYNFLLNAQGRILGDCTIYRADTHSEAEAQPEFILQTTAAQVDTIEALLESFIIMDEVELTRILYVGGPIPAQRGLAVMGRHAAAWLQQTLDLLTHSVVRLPPTGHTQPGDADGSPLVVFAPPAASAPDTFQVFCQSGLHLDLLRQNLLSMGAVSLSPAAIEADRVLSGRPSYGVDIRNNESGRDLPQETGQTHALHFNKGCYLGQEIVERIRSRGQVHRTFARFALQGVPPAMPAPLTATLAGQTRPAGELTSVTHFGDTLHALGYVRRELSAQPLSYPGGTAVITDQR